MKTRMIAVTGIEALSLGVARKGKAATASYQFTGKPTAKTIEDLDALAKGIAHARADAIKRQ